MLFSPIYSLFMITLVMGSLLSISSSSWFGAWVGLELNLMSFIPLISSKLTSSSSEVALKYFLIQALGSSIIILSSSLLLTYINSAAPLILTAILLKLGSAPFHFWFPQIMEGLMWPQVIIISTIQKLAPMFLISYIVINPFIMNLLLLSAISSAMVGALGGINQMNLRKIIAFSSINHMAWMLSAIAMKENLWILYFSFYCLISSSVIMLFHSIKAFHFSNLLNHLNNSPMLAMLTPMSLLSLGGLPPFSGFIPKWILIQMMASEKNTPPIICTSSLNTNHPVFLSTNFYYIFNYINSLFKMKNKIYYKKNNKISLIIFINLFGLLFPALMLI
uniref:NADH-ubiquinone oxidoreductase chain 2 n=1 Tax=Dynomene pilumnoides TaxID=1702342 RepID=A0A1B0RXN9_9EUCA|nr:NADH dehydrogenase subunit 2 [Dynomene pilumnoides]